MMESNKAPAPQREKAENPLLDIMINIAIPAVIWIKLSPEEYLGPKWGFIIALLFPLGYGIYEMLNRKKFNALAMLGFISILLTGGIGLLQLDNQWLAVKEASVPAVFAFLVLASLKTQYPLVKKFLYNEKMMDIHRVQSALMEKGNEQAFEKLLVHASYLLACSFILSSVLNFVLAKIIVIAPPGTVAYNQQLGRLTALSYPVIALPSTIVMLLALWFLLRGIKKLTGLNLEAVFRLEQPAAKKSE
jgi:hypothetical protein